MPLVTIAEARAHVRVEADYPEDQLQGALDGAIASAESYLNRRIFESAEAIGAARQLYPAGMKAAALARDSALSDAVFIENGEERTAAIELAAAVYAEAAAGASECLHGIVMNPAVRAAILLTFGHLYSNRSDVVVGAQVVELPVGAKSLLRGYRRVMMP